MDEQKDNATLDAELQVLASNLSGIEKAAILLVSLGVETTSKILRDMRDDEVELLSIEVAKVRNVSKEIMEAVILEYRDMTMARDYISQGGILFARDALQSAVGQRRADEIIMRIEAAMQVSAFHLLQTIETSQLTNFLQNEHPQTAALILAHLNPRKSADIIEGLDDDLKHGIMYPFPG
jgi:flagellar motor switch protein FliG